MMRRCVPLLLLAALLLSLTCATVQAGEWFERSDTPFAGGYGEAVVGTGDSIYVARCMYATSVPSFQRYDPDTDSWTAMNTSGLQPFRNGMSMAWDRNDCIYSLLGGRYTDDDRTLFYRYRISTDMWQQLADTPHAQGAGDAIAWSEYDDRIYAMVGSNTHGAVYLRYNYDSWETLTFNPTWTFSDDGASLASVGEHLFALRGEYDEDVQNGDFARYHIPTDTWGGMTPMPENDGVGDGGSLLYIGDQINGHSDFIFALGGGEVDEDPGYNFYRYSISHNDWEPLESPPCPIGYYVGNRMGYANNSIYYWQGAPSTWDCGGDAFYMFEFELTGDIKGDLNGDGQITTADAIIALQMAVSGEHSDPADVNSDGWVTSVDALMILHAAVSAIEL